MGWPVRVGRSKARQGMKRKALGLGWENSADMPKIEPPSGGFFFLLRPARKYPRIFYNMSPACPQ